LSRHHAPWLRTVCPLPQWAGIRQSIGKAGWCSRRSAGGLTPIRAGGGVVRSFVHGSVPNNRLHLTLLRSATEASR